MSELRITEIFYSLQGETKTVGLPTVFIRLTGCPLRCGYCDTEYAFKGGEKFSIDEVLQKVGSYKAQHVTVSGGEPLAQKNCIPLLTALCDASYSVSLETCGALAINDVDKRVMTVMDIKTPASGEVHRNLYRNFDHISQHDQIKFVICDRQDYIWSKAILEQYQLADKCEVLFSPSYQQLSGGDLAEWILDDHLPVRFQVQLHKVLWGDEQGR